MRRKPRFCSQCWRRFNVSVMNPGQRRPSPSLTCSPSRWGWRRGGLRCFCRCRRTCSSWSYLPTQCYSAQQQQRKVRGRTTLIQLILVCFKHHFWLKKKNMTADCCRCSSDMNERKCRNEQLDTKSSNNIKRIIKHVFKKIRERVRLTQSWTVSWLREE